MDNISFRIIQGRYRFLSIFIILIFLSNVILPPTQAQTLFPLPMPGTMITPTQNFSPVTIIGNQSISKSSAKI